MVMVRSDGREWRFSQNISNITFDGLQKNKHYFVSLVTQSEITVFPHKTRIENEIHRMEVDSKTLQFTY